MKLRNKKTGEIIKDAQYRNYGTKDGFVITTPTDRYSYKSLKEFCEDWEDAEDINVTNIPLIEDDEIREIVRAWADVNDAGKLKYNSDENSLDDIYRNTITFNRGLGLEDGKKYTIAELCGEGETPEPVEPTFVDLDERIKEKRENANR